jgi:hypothetical protein
MKEGNISRNGGCLYDFAWHIEQTGEILLVLIFEIALARCR